MYFHNCTFKQSSESSDLASTISNWGAGKVKTLALVMFPYLASGDRTIASAYGVVFIAATLAVFLLFEVLLRKQTAREIDYFNG